MKCTINKLAAVVSDNSLPVLSGLVILKNYIKTTADGQYIDLSSIFGQIAYNNMAVDATVQHQGLSGVTTTLLQSTSGYSFIYITTMKRISTHIGSATANLVTVTENTDVQVGFNGPNKSAYVGETTATTETAVSSSTPNAVYLFKNIDGTNSTAGAVKMKEMKVYDTGVLVADLVPATYDGVACLYDKVNEVPYYEANGGTLSVE